MKLQNELVTLLPVLLSMYVCVCRCHQSINAGVKEIGILFKIRGTVGSPAERCDPLSQQITCTL